jgi:hypothetical protein
LQRIDMMDSFLRDEQNMFHPSQFLRRIKAAIESGKKFYAGFNITNIELIDKEIHIFGDHGGEMMISLDEFETRLLAFYKKYPYEFGEDFEKIEIPNFNNQLDSLVEKIKADLKRFNKIHVYYVESYSEYRFHAHIKDYTKEFLIFSTLTSIDGIFIEYYAGDLTPEQNDDPEVVKLLPAEALQNLRSYILERVKVFEHNTV